MTTHLGTFERSGGGYVGTLETLSFSAIVQLRPNVAENEKAPDYRVFSESGREIGAAWVRKSRKGSEFISLKVQDPALGSLPIYPSLVQSERNPGNWTLLLNNGGTSA